jgi:hypothetical protein
MGLLLSRLKKLKREEKGQSLVEFAFVSLPLLLLLLGMIEFGWLFNGQLTITSAAREGARAVAVGEDPWAAVERHVKPTALKVTEVFVAPGGKATERWNLVRVTGQIEPLVGLFVSSTVNLSAEATMRQE